MPRLFTAIEIPETMRLRLSLLRAPLSGAKWVEPGEHAHHAALCRRHRRPHGRRLRRRAGRGERAALHGDDCGHRRLRRPRAARAVGRRGGRPELEALYRANERAARAAGLEPPTARVQAARHAGAHARRAAAGRSRAFWRRMATCALEPFMVTRFVLLSARPGSGGPPYGVEAAYPLSTMDEIDEYSGAEP